MISAHQPTIFSDNLLVCISSIADGNMKVGIDGDSALHNQREFLKKLRIMPDQTTLLQVTYEGENYLRYRTSSNYQSHLVADGIATDQHELALFLPLADCTGAVLHDPITGTLMLSHLGRHSTEQLGGKKSVEYMSKHFAVDPKDLVVWLSPSPNGDDYPLWQFKNRSFRDVLVEQLLEAGVSFDNIEASDVDTVKSQDYFSHSEYLKGNRKNDGRYAIVAMIR